MESNEHANAGGHDAGTLNGEYGRRRSAVTKLRKSLETPMIMSSFCLGGALVSMDSTIMGVALPTISADLAMNSTEYSWAGSSFLLAGAISMPLWEPISDAFGRKAVLAGGLMLFFLGSILAAVARSSAMLISGRVVQGIGDGAFTVMANVCMADLFPLRERGLYIAMYSGASCIGAVLAPLVGGALTEYAGWQWIFWINLPVSAATAALALGFLPFPLLKLSNWHELERIDLPGMLLITSSTMLLLLGLQFGGVIYSWSSATVICLLAFGAVTLVLFVLQQQRWRAQKARPLIPLRIFRDRTAAACLSVMFLHGLAYIVALYYIPIYLELVLDIRIVHVGLWLLLTAVPTTIVTVAAALLIRQTGRYARITQASAGFLAVGLGLCVTFPSYKSLARIICFQVILALGIGPLFQAPLIGLQAAVAKDEVSSSYATAIFLRTIGSAVGLVIGEVVLSNELRGTQGMLVDAGVPNEIVGAIQQDLGAILRYNNGADQERQQRAVHAAVSFSLSRVWIACTVVAGVGFVVSCLIKDLPLVEHDGCTVDRDA